MDKTTLDKILNRFLKWKMVFAGWQLGSRGVEDPEAQAVRDHREVSMLMRAEINAITQLLIRRGVFSEEEFMVDLANEAELLSKAYEKKFPGFKAIDGGMEMDERAASTMKGWRK